jgi:hypothetical protein
MNQHHKDLRASVVGLLCVIVALIVALIVSIGTEKDSSATGTYSEGYAQGYAQAQKQYVKIAGQFEDQAKNALVVANKATKGWKSCRAKLADLG